MKTTFLNPTFARRHSRFTRRTKAANAPLNKQATPTLQLHVNEPYESAIEALHRSFDRVMKKLDRIEAKVDLLGNAIKLPE